MFLPQHGTVVHLQTRRKSLKSKNDNNFIGTEIVYFWAPKWTGIKHHLQVIKNTTQKSITIDVCQWFHALTIRCHCFLFLNFLYAESKLDATHEAFDSEQSTAEMEFVCTRTSERGPLKQMINKTLEYGRAEHRKSLKMSAMDHYTSRSAIWCYFNMVY